MDRLITILATVGEHMAWTAWWFGAPIVPWARPRTGSDTVIGPHARPRTPSRR